MREALRRALRYHASALLLGESGTGKEVAAADVRWVAATIATARARRRWRNRRLAAERLAIGVRTLYEKLERYGIDSSTAE